MDKVYKNCKNSIDVRVIKKGRIGKGPKAPSCHAVVYADDTSIDHYTGLIHP